MINKVILIITREYLTRVRKRSFIIMSLLGPLLIGIFYGAIFWSALAGGEGNTIQVIDESQIFKDKLPDTQQLFFSYSNLNIDRAKAEFLEKNDFDALLYIPELNLDSPQGVQLFSVDGISTVTKKKIEGLIENELENLRLKQKAGIDRSVLDNLEVSIEINTINLSEEGEEGSNAMASTVVGLFFGFIIYLFVFLYGAQVMRGIMEEKTNRIVEVVISTVKPFYLMIGKIIGIAGVGLTQILIWVLLGLTLVSIASTTLLDNTSLEAMSTTAQQDTRGLSPQAINNALQTIDFPVLIGGFMFYFLFGYLMYGALFGAIGAAVDSETDTQQFMLPISIPLIFSITMSTAIISEPNGSMAFWLSVVPFTSPVAMMIRLPFVGLSWDLALSMVLLVAAFIGTTWLAARIYRVGILMYGKKVTYKDLGKWLFYKF